MRALPLSVLLLVALGCGSPASLGVTPEMMPTLERIEVLAEYPEGREYERLGVIERQWSSSYHPKIERLAMRQRAFDMFGEEADAVVVLFLRDVGGTLGAPTRSFRGQVIRYTGAPASAVAGQ